MTSVEKTPRRGVILRNMIRFPLLECRNAAVKFLVCFFFFFEFPIVNFLLSPVPQKKVLSKGKSIKVHHQKRKNVVVESETLHGASISPFFLLVHFFLIQYFFFGVMSEHTSQTS